MNEKNLQECNQLVDSIDPNKNNFQDLSVKLESLNPVQCFDMLNKLCGKYSSTTANDELDQLILKYIIRFRNNGGFFLALKDPQYPREHLLRRLADTILLNQEYAQKANLTLADIHQ